MSDETISNAALYAFIVVTLNRFLCGLFIPNRVSLNGFTSFYFFCENTYAHACKVLADGLADVRERFPRIFTIPIEFVVIAMQRDSNGKFKFSPEIASHSNEKNNGLTAQRCLQVELTIICMSFIGRHSSKSFTLRYTFESWIKHSIRVRLCLTDSESFEFVILKKMCAKQIRSVSPQASDVVALARTWIMY